MDVVHIALLGDSIFDNSSYTRGEPDVVTHLRALLPAGARATLLAVDGAITRSLTEQARGIPADATHLVVSICGNDLAISICSMLARRRPPMPCDSLDRPWNASRLTIAPRCGR
jgi:hypothetical protein